MRRSRGLGHARLAQKIQTSSQGVAFLLTSRIRHTPEHNWSVLVLLGSQDLMELERESVEVPNVQWAEVVVKCVVEEGIVNCEVVWLFSGLEARDWGWAVDSPLGSLGRRFHD